MTNLEKIAILSTEKLKVAQKLGGVTATNIIMEVIEMIDRAIESVISLKIDTDPYTEPDNVDIRIQLEEKLSSSTSLLVHYLPSSSIDNGIGTIKTNSKTIEFFKNYTEDAYTLPASHLTNWPIGFYRNKETTDIQLLIKTDSFIICFDGLPSNKLNIKVAAMPYNEKTKMMDYENLSIDELVNITYELENILKYYLT